MNVRMWKRKHKLKNNNRMGFESTIFADFCMSSALDLGSDFVVFHLNYFRDYKYLGFFLLLGIHLGYYLGLYLGFFFGLLFWLLFKHLFGHLFRHLFGLLFGLLFWHLFRFLSKLVLKLQRQLDEPWKIHFSFSVIHIVNMLP